MHKSYMSPTRALPAIRFVIAATLVVMVPACASSKGKAITPLTAPRNQTTSTADPVTTTTLVNTVGAAIAADQTEIATYFQIASANPVNPADPRLAMVSMGKALSYHRNQLTILSLKRQHDVGTFIPTQSTVTQRNTAGLPAGDVEAVVVSSCAIDTIAVVDDDSGQVVTPATNSRDPITERLDLVNGHWLVSETGTGSGTC